MARRSAKVASRAKRIKRVRLPMRTRADRPRLTVFRSNRNICAQIIDDRSGVTLAAASTLDKGFRKKPGTAFTRETAREVGKRLAGLATEKNVAKVVFDRGPYLYHGKVKALADGAREGGLDF